MWSDLEIHETLAAMTWRIELMKSKEIEKNNISHYSTIFPLEFTVEQSLFCGCWDNPRTKNPQNIQFQYIMQF